MRGFILIAAIAFAALGALADDDHYLYWMVSGDNDIEFDYAKVKVRGEGQDAYLPLHYEAKTYPDVVEFDSDTTKRRTPGADLGLGIYVDMLTYATEGSSFLIELYKDGSANPVGSSASADYSSLGDYILKNAQSQVAAPWAPAIASVPEPTGGLLMLLGTVVLALRRKRASVI